MLITEHFVFVHMPKTGGAFVRELCRRHLSPIVEFELHPTYSQVPPEFAELPALSFIRNPWDWYVSVYHYTHEQVARGEYQGRGVVWKEILSRPFEDAVTRACTLRELSPESGPSGPFWYRIMKERDCDYYTAMHLLMTAESDRVEIGRYENLRTDLLAFMDRHKVPIDNGFREAVLTSEPIYPPWGSPKRAPYQSHYDETLRDLVASSCPLVDRYGYSFEGEKPPE
jgi:hypothetical protein